jgi:hypothetical protein
MGILDPPSATSHRLHALEYLRLARLGRALGNGRDLKGATRAANQDAQFAFLLFGKQATGGHPLACDDEGGRGKELLEGCGHTSTATMKLPTTVAAIAR